MKYYEKLSLLVFIFSTVFYAKMDEYAWVPLIGVYVSAAVFLFYGETHLTPRGSDRATPEGKQAELFNINSGKSSPEHTTPGR